MSAEITAFMKVSSRGEFNIAGHLAESPVQPMIGKNHETLEGTTESYGEAASSKNAREEQYT